MKNTKTITIIGSGFSALAASCYLAKSGFQVTILEKNKTVGGRARQLSKEGFTFDIGPTWYWMPDVFEKFFGTPHPFTFANAAAMFELNYAQPYDVRQFTKAYRQAIKSKTSTIIEVMTSREENLKTHKELKTCYEF